MKVGNKQGWLMAGVVAVGYLSVWVAIERAAGKTRPTSLVNQGGWALQSLSLKLAADQGAGDGTAVLEEIVRTVKKDWELYERFTNSPAVDEELLPRLAVIDLVVAQQKYGTGSLFQRSPQRVVGYELDGMARGDVDALLLAGRCVNRVALLHRVKGRQDEAKRLFESGLALGIKIFEGRQTYVELSGGLGLISEAVGVLKKIAQQEKNKPWEDGLIAMEDQIADLNQRIAPTWLAISTVDGVLVARHAGDIPVLAERSKERVWRVEATLKLGRMRYYVGNSGTIIDVREAERKLVELAEDEDPAVAWAAKLARELTVEEFRMLR